MFSIGGKRKLLVGVLLSLMIVLLASVTSAEERAFVSAEEAAAKIHPNLMADVEAGLTNQTANALQARAADSAAGQIQFVARITAGADLSAYADQWFARPYVDPAGNTVASGFASANSILKMASDPDVISLQRAESLITPPATVDPDVAESLNRDFTPTINLDADAAPGPAPEGWYGTGGAIHGSQAAWDKGFTGQGVRYMSNDSGADYCHADLMHTWAYIDDDTSPYYGLPQMFDSWSSYVISFDYFLGTSFIAGGLADYADTSATAAGDFSYAPLGAAVAHDYTVTGTSLSGEYHYGAHPDNALAANAGILSSFFGDGTAVGGERAAVLVVDENEAGVYDTVYVDINYNFDFSDDTPARLGDFSGQETACLDYNFDGLNDVSGGLVYFISNGVDAIPTLDWYWGIPGSAYGPGDLVAFHVMDYTEGGGDHGMGTTSVAVGQGRTAGSLTWGPVGSPIADFQGLVVGPGRDVGSTQAGNFYITPFIEDAYIYAGLGYDGIPGNGDDIQIVSNSWGFSGTDNDGFDPDSRLIDLINRSLAVNTTLIFSTGNGAAGYGTAAPPSPSAGIGVGASTLYGTIGLFEPIASADQIVGGDVISWSNRGPGVLNSVGADVVATGAFGTGSVSLNQVLDGSVATDNFGGTSMAGPVAAGNLALIYDAFLQANGRWPFFFEAKDILMNSATNIDHDVWSQGAGLVNADAGTDIAAGLGGFYVTPSQWRVGDFRGEEYAGFAHIIEPGETDVQEFTIANTSDKMMIIRVSSNTLMQIGADDYSFTSEDQALEHGSFTTPDYVFQIDGNIPPRTDLLMARLTKPHNQFDPDENLSEPFSNWRIHLQDWTDLNGDGEYWIDVDNDGMVDATGEMQTGEHIRYTYGYNTGPTQQARVSNPLERMTDGLLLTLRHRNRIAEVPNTDLDIEVSYWKQRNWSWVTPKARYIAIKPGDVKTLPVRIKVPKNAPYGMYEGSLNLVSKDGEVVIPITVAVAASGTSFEFGAEQLDDARHRGQYKSRPTLYENAFVFGYTDYGWRAESGDWRFFWTDIAAEDLPETGTNFLVVDNAWASAGTDIDTIIVGPAEDCNSNNVGCTIVTGGAPNIWGPYTLDIVGRSVNSYIGSGRWAFNTSTGGNRDIVAAPASEGLHGILLHQVRVDGGSQNEAFGGSVGLINLSDTVVEATGAAGTGSADLTISTDNELGAFVAQGFGLGAPVTTLESIDQDDPNDYTTGTVFTVDVVNGAKLEISTVDLFGDDIDLFVEGPDGTLLGSSTTPTGVESVTILFPEDGTYTAYVQGWSVTSTGVDNVEVTINAVQGTDVVVTNLPDSIPAGGSATLTVEWDTTGFAAGTYEGVILMGPAEAPGLLEVPVLITVE